MKTRLLVMAIIFIGLGVWSCQKDDAATKRLADLQAFAQAEVSIERLRKMDNPDWTEIKAQYDICSGLVRDMDGKGHTDYAEDIPEAIKRCSNNERVKVNQQTLAKGLQHVAVLKIRGLIGSMAGADAKTRANIAVEIGAVFEGIRPTFIRRDKDFFEGKSHLEKGADQALAELKKARGSDYITSASRLEGIINRTYALCVLYEMLSVEKLRETDIPACDVKLAEAVIFYRIIEPRVKKTDRNAHKDITAMLEAEYSSVNTKLLTDSLNRGLSITILSER